MIGIVFLMRDPGLSTAMLRLNNTGIFKFGNVSEIPFDDASFDVVVSGLAWSFFPDLNHALSELMRVINQMVKLPPMFGTILVEWIFKDIFGMPHVELIRVQNY